jgi:Domain of unknown function (DUF4157)
MSFARLGRRVALPGHVRTALESLFGADVDKVEIIEHSLFARLHLRAVATTRRRRIYLRDSAETFFENPTLMLHEYCHVLKQWEPGTMTVARYLGECLRRGYWDNRFEIEAREFAQDHAYRFRALLSRSPQQSFASIQPAGK